MSHRLVVPVDGSHDSWRAVDHAFALAHRTGAGVVLVSVEYSVVDRQRARDHLEVEVRQRQPLVEVEVEVRLAIDSVAAEIAAVADASENSLVVMSSHGRGRSTAIVGSVTDGVLRRISGPTLLIGPRSAVGRLDGPVVIAVDGSERSERSLPDGVRWAEALGVDAWVVHVGTETFLHTTDLAESAYIEGLARREGERAGRTVQHEELHGRRPIPAITEYVDSVGASMLVASSHGRTGIEKLTMGSVSSGFVRRAACPVLLVRGSPIDPLPAEPRVRQDFDTVS
ncbi:MAG: universal stress protein [Actinomycetota bacterium]